MSTHTFPFLTTDAAEHGSECRTFALDNRSPRGQLRTQ